ncbi:MAG: secondary thiamine-phosphate synthase enzyme YjbQ [Candidatus Woesearchaeota archaeon]
MEEFSLSTKKRNEIIDITKEVKKLTKKVKDGICVIFTPHTTTAITVIENYDPNIAIDFLKSLADNIPQGKWLHDKVDENADAHIKASIIGPSQIFIIKNREIQLGTWQNVVFCEFDGPRERKVLVETIEK